MRLENEREQLVAFGKKLISSRLTTGAGGNLSILNREEGLVAITPSGMDYFSIQPEDIVLLDLDGNVVEGNRKPSSEWRFHLALLKHREDINAVAHTHSVYATTIACLNWELPAVHYLVGFSGDKVPLCPYATYGTQELSDHILNSIGSYNVVLLANHGLIAVGHSMERAFAAAEEIELVSQIYYQAKCIGNPVILNSAQMDEVLLRFQGYGQGKK
jgi:L-fuculose-phosphate aldolase